LTVEQISQDPALQQQAVAQDQQVRALSQHKVLCKSGKLLSGAWRRQHVTAVAVNHQQQIHVIASLKGQGTVLGLSRHI
jgi:hypothetical protein